MFVSRRYQLLLVAVSTVIASTGLGVAADAAGRGGKSSETGAHNVTAKRRPLKGATTALVNSTSTLSEITSAANWIVSNQFPNGAIAQGITPASSTSVYIEPYTANYAAIGLARASSVTGDEAYAQASWSWLHWYADNEQTGTGFVSDATMAYPFVSGESSSPLGTMDSTDAYAGTFLLAVYDTMVADPSASELLSLKQGIAGAVQAISETQQSDGLTWALPSYQVAYLMDNAEAHAGLLAAASLEAALNNSSAEVSDEAAASRMEAGIQSMWNPRTESFDWAVSPGAVDTTNWSYLYPDAASQAWAVGLGAATTTQANAVMSEIESNHVQWDAPTAMASFRGSAQSAAGYWPGVGWGFDATGQNETAQVGAASIDAAAAATDDYWPYSTQDAGQLIVLFAGGPTLAPSVPAAP